MIWQACIELALVVAKRFSRADDMYAHTAKSNSETNLLGAGTH